MDPTPTRSASPETSAVGLIRRANELLAANKPDDAVAAARAAVGVRPDLPEAHYALACALVVRPPTDLAAATAHLREAVRLRPHYVEALNTLGWALRQAGDLDGAARTFADAIRANPDVAEPHQNLGTALYELGRLDEAVASQERAVRLRPADPKAHFDLSLALLASGRWERGWAEFEWRRHALRDPADQLVVPHPHWTGWNPAGITLLVVCEQGLGDVLQFIRYVPLLADRGARVVVQVHPPLRELVRTVRGVTQVVARGDPLPPFDAHVKLLSLPTILGTRLATVPAEVPYIHPDPAREAAWAVRLRGPGFKVGINWAGSGLMHMGGVRSAPLAAFEPLARVPGVRLFSLQQRPGTGELAALAGRFEVETFDDPPLDVGDGAAFTDTAAVARHLDLIVTCDTSVAHLAGAVGARTWVALPAACDWRWMRDRDDSPWYPTLRLFRQERPDDWAEVFDSMATALRELADGSSTTGGAGSANLPAPSSPSPVMAPMSPGEVLDRLAILQIKIRRFGDPAKLAHARAELAALSDVREAAVRHTPEVDGLAVELRRVNEELWHLEDAVRAAEAHGDFGPAFVALARRVYRTNDRRADLKRKVNAMLGSPWGDQKEYRQTASPPSAVH